ncbi:MULTISPECIES: alpha-pore-forming tripartite toxin MakABE regulator [Dickeya]|uniref:alpha-pore-forming tripartite toxin MakABE regulator n=1 Tax=Dickeya TaxID=204037 RepID=UPI0031638D5F
MKIINVLIVVNTTGTLTSGNITGYAYLVDSNGFLGSWGEGSAALHTVAQNGDQIQWHVVPVSPWGDVTITGFSGPLVEQGICQPQKEAADGSPWLGWVESRGQFSFFSYEVTVLVGEKTFSLNAAIDVV